MSEEGVDIDNKLGGDDVIVLGENDVGIVHHFAEILIETHDNHHYTYKNFFSNN